jgi:hypothetical protein
MFSPTKKRTARGFVAAFENFFISSFLCFASKSQSALSMSEIDRQLQAAMVVCSSLLSFFPSPLCDNNMCHGNVNFIPSQD